jgi:glyoxylase-like metal-dependent hydrolase (beta-lactamase superfamily II)
MVSQKLQVEMLIVGPLSSNCYIVWDEGIKIAAIIDPGEDGKDIINKVDELELDVKYILATHGHFDHVGAVAQLKKLIDVEFLAHKDDFFFIEDGENAARRWGFIIDQPPKPDRFIEDGDIIKLGNYELKVLHTPGHSPGGVSFLHNNMVFCGDTLFQGSIGRTDFRMGSFEELKQSIITRLYSLPDKTIVFTGHGPSTTIGDEKEYNAFVRI